MSPAVRKAALIAHVTSSVGWLGSVVTVLALAVVGVTSGEDQTVRAAYLAMDVLGWAALVPFAVASLVTGVVQSLGTPSGLFRHYWVVVKLVLTLATQTERHRTLDAIPLTVRRLDVPLLFQQRDELTCCVTRG